MPLELYGDADGEGLSKAGSSLEIATADGAMTLTLANNAALTVKDDAGAVLARLDESSRWERVARVALAAVDTGGGLFAWQNPESVSILVTRVVLDVTTNTSGASTADIGTTATSATTSSDNLLDGVSLATAAKQVDNLGDPGTNGTTRQKLASGKWVTGSIASGASAGLVGYAYIHYHPI